MTVLMINPFATSSRSVFKRVMVIDETKHYTKIGEIDDTFREYLFSGRRGSNQPFDVHVYADSLLS